MQNTVLDCDIGTGRPLHRRMEVWLSNKGIRVRAVGQREFISTGVSLPLDKDKSEAGETGLVCIMVKGRTPALIIRID